MHIVGDVPEQGATDVDCDGQFVCKLPESVVTDPTRCTYSKEDASALGVPRIRSVEGIIRGHEH